jgi:hypothetical protein
MAASAHNSRSVPVDTPLHSTSMRTSSWVGGVNVRRLSSICSGCFSTTAMVSIAFSFDGAEKDSAIVMITLHILLSI